MGYFDTKHGKESINKVVSNHLEKGKRCGRELKLRRQKKER